MSKFIFAILFCCFVFTLQAEDFNLIQFADTLKYEWNTPIKRYEFRNELELKKSIMDRYEAERLNVPLNISRSMIIPGLGHMQTKDYLRGQIILSAEIILAGSTYFLYDKAMEKYDKYKQATQIDQINQYYSDADSYYKQSGYMAGLFFFVWGYNVYDTFITTQKYNSKLWKDLLNEKKEKKLQITPTGFSYRF